MKFILVPIFALLICQGIKILIFLYHEQEFSWHKLIWEGFWAGKFPSSHAAILSSSLYLLITYSENYSISVFAVIISILLAYGLLEDKKRHQMIETYLCKSNDPELRKISSDQLFRDFNGHTLYEIVTGTLIGILCAVLLENLL